MFSVSTIYSVKDFLELISKHPILVSEFNEAFGKFRFEIAPKVLRLATECRWAFLRTDGLILLSERGESIASMGYKKALIMQLEDMILNYNPTWASLLPKGRDETIPFLPEEVAQCFKEAGLTEELTDELIHYWDKLALAYRNYNQQQLLETGRLGEKLSIKYETDRTEKIPIWQSVESNLSGFDILSVIDNTSTIKLLIEVKASVSNMNYAFLYVSRNEWRTAENCSNYQFHLWLIEKVAKLYVVAPEVIRNHIATDLGTGEWQSVRIPFKTLIDTNRPNYEISLQ